MIIYLHPNATVRPELAKLVYQMRMHLWQQHGASMACVPITQPWAKDWVESVDVTGVIVWNGYGPDSAVELVESLERRSGKPAVRMEQGWFPQKDNIYLSEGLGAASTLANEIDTGRWVVNMKEHESWLAGIEHYPKPGLPSEYILVCGQVPGDSNLVSLTVPREDIPKLVRDSTDYQVVYRPHPKHPEPCDVDGVIDVSPDSDLMPQLSHARAVVAGTSTCLLEAASMSVPAVSLGMGVWTEDMVRHATGLTLRHVLDNITEGWDPYKRQYGVCVLRQQAQVSKRRPRWSTRNKLLLKGLV